MLIITHFHSNKIKCCNTLSSPAKKKNFLKQKKPVLQWERVLEAKERKTCDEGMYQNDRDASYYGI